MLNIYETKTNLNLLADAEGKAKNYQDFIDKFLSILANHVDTRIWQYAVKTALNRKEG
jgi:hypothetical protein